MLKADVNEFPVLCDLYQPKAHDNLVDLVFVHGLGGTFRGTWTADGAPRPWIENPEFLGPLKDKVRILSFGYNANRFGEVANTRIIHHANSLLRALFRKRIDCQERPIIFIAHSLGGLVVKRAILLCPTNDDWHAIKSATKGVVFMGTPHMGAEQANYLSLAQNFLSLVKLEQPVATNLTKELELFSTTMQDINQEFSIDVHRSIKLICFYESVPQRLPHGKSVIIVPQWSAILQGVESQDLSCTHSELPKFKDPSEARFETFWGEVQLFVRKADTNTLSDQSLENRFAELRTPSHLISSPEPITMTQSLSELRGGSIGTNAQGTAQHRTPTEDNPADYSNLHGQLWMGDHQSSGQLLLTKYVAATRTVEGFPLSCHGISISSPNIGCQREPVFRVEPGARDAEGCEIFQFHSSDDSMLPWPPTPIREAEKTMNISSLIFQVKLERRRTYAAIDPKLFTPDEKHRFRGIWIGEFSSLYRFEFFLLHQPVEGKLEAIKITGDVLIPRGEYSFTVEDLSSSQSRWQARARWRVPLFGVRIAAANLELVNEDEFKLWVDNIFSGFTLTLKRISWGHSPLRASLKATTV